jgi:preprotein translocase subunit SecA
MDSLREAVYLRAYGQKDPLVEYKTEAYQMFTDLMASIKAEVCHNLFRSTSNLEAFGAFLQSLPQFLIHADETGAQTTESTGRAAPKSSPASRIDEGPEPSMETLLQPVRRDAPKVGRNDPCPCGSGKKYKNCCGRAA